MPVSLELAVDGQSNRNRLTSSTEATRLTSMPLWRCTKAVAAFALLLLPAVPAWALEPAWRSFSTADGLPSNSVMAIAQDGVGTLWVGTDAGLCTFFGQRFQRDAIPAGAGGAGVQALLATPEKELWVATNAGLFRRQAGGRWMRTWRVRQGSIPSTLALLRGCKMAACGLAPATA